MGRFPCSVCGRRRPEKLSTAYWVWYPDNGERVCHKLRYCLECAGMSLHGLLVRSLATEEPADLFTCTLCGTDASHDGESLFVTLYVPGRERTDLSLLLDTACAVKWRGHVTELGERMENRSLDGSPGVGMRGPSSIDPWERLGLSPVA
jgi:hypothetical protein